MDLDKIKKTSIPSYLQSIGCRVKKDRGYYGMYHAPYRNDHTNPSLKIDYKKNIWIDFGTGEGGSIIDLVMKVENCSFTQAISKLHNEEKTINSFSFHREIPINKNNKSKIKIMSISPITDNVIIQYLNFRKIPIDIAREYCKEVRYQIKNIKYEFKSVGFMNNSKGYTLRNYDYLQCTESDITTFEFPENDYSQCLVFEGFFDFLSYLVFQDIKKINTNTVILNSVVNLNKALPFLEKHDFVITYLDNDEAGRNTTLLIQKQCKNVTDKSSSYIGCNDLNDHLISKSKDKF